MNVLFVALLSEQRAVDSDENIMEGGVTIRRRRKTRAPVCIRSFTHNRNHDECSYVLALSYTLSENASAHQ